MFRKTLTRFAALGAARSEHEWVRSSGSRVLCSTKATVRPADTQRERRLLGQPTPYTHPHLMTEGELVPGIKRFEFQDRRERLLCAIRKHALWLKSEYHLVIIPAAPKLFMSQKVPYVYRQNSDFLYLSGCLEPDSVLVMVASQNGSSNQTMMFMRERDAHSELWDGPRTGVGEAPELFGVDVALPITELKQYLNTFSKTYPDFFLWYDFVEPVDTKVQQMFNTFLKEQGRNITSMESPRKLIHLLRIFKSPAEQKLMKKSCDIASAAISATIASSHPGITEHQLFARVDYECRMRGAEYLAYPPVVAGGERANIIHYINNTQVIPDNEMVLMDAGCEYHSYTSDITRTWPVNGRFSPRQRELYEALLSVQVELISLLGSLPTLDNMFNTMCRLLGKRLQEVGLISGKITSDQDLAKVGYSFCPHHVSHYLGMDVHDTGLIERNIPLQPGMVVTMEPGVYVNKNNKHANPEFHGTGIRIEDDILITENGPEVLTVSCPKHPSDIEALFSSPVSR